MKKMIAVGLVGLALGLVLPGVVAQAPQAEVQKWEQFCELYNFGGRGDMITDRANPSAAAHGKTGYQLVVGTRGGGGGNDTSNLVLCYRRPAR